MVHPQFVERLEQYLILRPGHVKIEKFLGEGTDGAVWAASSPDTFQTAIKVFERERGYFNERDTYLRLAQFGVINTLGRFSVPVMHHHNDTLMIVEMDLMATPPYIIDFAKVRLDRPPDFSPETLRDMEEQGQELFERNWPAVKTLLSDLESFQIYYLDPKPHNIVF